MSPIDPDVPAAGEEIHLPGPSLLPLALTAAITVALLGLTFGPVLWVPGVIVALIVIVRWVRSTARDIDELPLEHGH